MVELKKETSFSAIIYPHPIERRLKINSGILPPYSDAMETAGIEIAWEGTNSLLTFYEPSISISISSTLSFDRLHYGLNSLFYTGNNIPDYNVDGRFLGEWNQYGFKNTGELKEKLKELLGKK